MIDEGDPTLHVTNQTLLAAFAVAFSRLIFIHLRCWEVLPFSTIQRQQCIKFRVLRAQDFYTPLPLNCQKGQHLPAPEVKKKSVPRHFLVFGGDSFRRLFAGDWRN